MLPAVPDDCCARPRAGAWDLGAVQHSLGDCAAVLPPTGQPGTTVADGGTPGDGVDSTTSSPSGGGAAGGGSGAAAAGDGGCHTGRGRSWPIPAAIAFVALALSRRRERH